MAKVIDLKLPTTANPFSVTYKGLLIDRDLEEILTEYDPVNYLRECFNAKESLFAFVAIGLSRRPPKYFSLTELWEVIKVQDKEFKVEDFILLVNSEKFVVCKNSQRKNWVVNPDIFRTIKEGIIYNAQHQ